jgi:hypothetical protein
MHGEGRRESILPILCEAIRQVDAEEAAKVMTELSEGSADE